MRRITVYPTHERYKPETRKKGFKRTIPPLDKKKFDPLPDEVAEELFKQQAVERDQDKNKTAEIVFLHGNELWRLNPRRYDVLGLDAPNVPEYPKVPVKAYPNQIIKVKRGGRWHYYKGDRTGKFRRTFPPNAKKYQKSVKIQWLKESNSRLRKEANAYESLYNQRSNQMSNADRIEMKRMINARRKQIEFNNREIEELRK